MVRKEPALPWVPRPAEEVCKTYGHIFRLLKDPSAQRKAAPKQKRSVHVSVPRVRSAVDGDLAPVVEMSDMDEDKAMPLSKAGGKPWNSQSSPDLHANAAGSGYSTTAG